MRYLSIYRSETSVEGGDPSPEHMQAMMALIEEWTAKGHLLSTEPLTPRDRCARVTMDEAGAFSVSPEAERASGFAMMQFDSLEAAVEGCKAFLKVAGPGTCELRQILEFAPQPQMA
ncbi:MAG: hypothetical protein JSS35_18685 [Proteobacteria bacterium]|nr:hypothetical protein [Pseudomonadota bacterium]